MIEERWELSRNQDASTGDRLADAARLVGGIVEGRMIFCRSVGSLTNDMHFSYNSASGNVFIYDCPGQLGANYKYLREKLSLLPRVSSRDTVSFAHRMWDETAPAEGSAVQRYFSRRGLVSPIPPALRYHGRLKHDSGYHPALVAKVTDSEDRFLGIHRTFLTFEGEKASIDPVRKSLGPIGGGAVRLALATDLLMVGEGIETCLAAMQLFGLPAWSALSCVGLRQLVLPDAVRDVVILVDGDDPGRNAAAAAWRKWRAEGRRVRLRYAPEGTDFNDVLLTKSKGARS